MGERTAIEWAANADGTPGATWNPVVGCQVHTPGCTNCYAMAAAGGGRLAATAKYAGLTQPSKAGPVWTGEVRLWERALSEPARRRKPTTWFVNSMGDLFADGVEDTWVLRVWAVMATCPQHTFIVLTKRADRMRIFVEALGDELLMRWVESRIPHPTGERPLIELTDAGALRQPLPNVWLLVTAEDQVRADERIPELLATPAAIRGVSYEPALGPLNLTSIEPIGGDATYDALRPYSDQDARESWGDPDARGYPALDWVICGGESGPKARPMRPDWARQVRDDCAAAGVPFFFKQWGEWASGPLNEGLGDGLVSRVGKRRAGRLLDGALHDARPALGGRA